MAQPAVKTLGKVEKPTLKETEVLLQATKRQRGDTLSVQHTGQPLQPEEVKEAAAKLVDSPLFSHVSEQDRMGLAKVMSKVTLDKGEFLIVQGQNQDYMFVLHSGRVKRLREDGNRISHVDIDPTIMGSLHLLRRESTFASIMAVSDKVEVFSLPFEKFKAYTASRPALQEEISYSLSRNLRSSYQYIRTPLLETEAKPSTLLATSVAAGTESFYRSALNALLNARLTNQGGQWTVARLLPNMHIQLPTRIMYINGFKGLRALFQDKYPPGVVAVSERPLALGLALAIAPGMIMTPISSVLEATHAHLNPEPLWRRCTRGLTFRGVRECIFGVGLNQLTDYCEERTPHTFSKPVRNALGSVTAGVLSGYLSHVPHNLSTLKLMNPAKSYRTLFGEFAKGREALLPSHWPAGRKAVSGAVLSILAPKGFHIRTGQICGSFVIINGIINLTSKPA